MLSRFLQGKKPPSQARVGITIGTQGILGVRVEQPFDQRPRLVAASYHPAEVDREWPKALRHLTEAMSAEGLPAVVQVHSQLASLLQLDLPNVPDAERASALKFRAREISPIPLDDMVLDYVEVPGMRARDTRIVCGHWSALGRFDGLGVHAIDTGCVWGGKLTAIELPPPGEVPRVIQVPGRSEPAPGPRED